MLPQQAPSFDITREDLITETLAILKCSNKTHNQIVLSVTPSAATFENVIIPLTEDDNVRADGLKIFVSPGSVSADPDLREASRKAEKLIARSETEFVMREDVFKLVDSVSRNH